MSEHAADESTPAPSPTPAEFRSKVSLKGSNKQTRHEERRWPTWAACPAGDVRRVSPRVGTAIPNSRVAQVAPGRPGVARGPSSTPGVLAGLLARLRVRLTSRCGGGKGRRRDRSQGTEGPAQNAGAGGRLRQPPPHAGSGNAALRPGLIERIEAYLFSASNHEKTVVFEGSTRVFGYSAREPSPFRQARFPQKPQKTRTFSATVAVVNAVQLLNRRAKQVHRRQPCASRSPLRSRPGSGQRW
jgi:hypothetical protein